MKKNIYLLALSFTSICLFISCSSSLDVGGCDTDKINNLSSDIIEKAGAYALDPSAENCQIYKSTIEEYLEELDKCDNLNESEIEEARENLEDLEC